MNADTMQSFPPRTLGDAVRGYRPPARVPNYELPVNLLARAEGYELGVIDGKETVDRGRIFVWGLVLGVIVAALVILGSLALS